jgi:hypothetical protein
MPLAFVVFTAFMWGYWILHGRPSTMGRVLAGLIALTGALAAYDGAILAYWEYTRLNGGRVQSAVVIGKSSTTDIDGAPRVRSRRARRIQLMAAAAGFKFHEIVGRIALDGSPDAWFIEYRYGCEHAQGCRGRDFVSEELWRRVHVGQAVNVRRDGAMGSSRLEENSQAALAIVYLATASTFLWLAWLVSERANRRRQRHHVPDIETAIHPAR